MSASERTRLGYTLPFEEVPLDRLPEIAGRAERAGYTDAWSGEVDGSDGFTPLVLAATGTEETRVGAGVVSAFTRGPALLAMSASAVEEAAPGRFCLGLGAGSDAVVEKWNAIRFERPYSRVRDVTAIVREALDGDRVTADLDTVSVSGIRLSRPPARRIPIFLAALRQRMLALAGEVSDGVLLNWLAPVDLPTVLREVDRGAAEAGRDRPEIACRVFVIPGEDSAAEYAARRFVAAYLNVPVYRDFHRWLGRGEALQPMNQAWESGDRKKATAAVPDEVLDGIFLTGGKDRIHDHIDAYRQAGVDTVILHWLPTADPGERGDQIIESLFELAPGEGA